MAMEVYAPRLKNEKESMCWAILLATRIQLLEELQE
jgi:hypothetical protein